MALTLSQTKTAVAVNITSSFLGVNGVPPYSYSVVAGGIGGTIDSATGVYTAPSFIPTPTVIPNPPNTQYDTVMVTDSTSATATSQILVGTPVDLLLDIIQTQLNLPIRNVYYWNQKIFQIDDTGLFVVAKIANSKPYSNISKPVNGSAVQYMNCADTIDINVMSQDMSAVLQRFQVLQALNSQYSQNQQSGNAFKLPQLPLNFVDASESDGTAILYRFVITISMLYAVNLSQAVDYYSSISKPVVYTNP